MKIGKTLANRARGALLVLGFGLAVSVCQTATEEPSPLVAGKLVAAASGSDAYAGTLAFAQAACGGCHAVEASGLSPNPSAPPFAEVANRPDLTRVTLATWLRDAHNFPEEMEFDLQGSQVEAIADYILTLRDPAYRPPAS